MAITVTEALKAGIKGVVDISTIKVEINFSGATWTDVSDLVEGDISGRFEETSSISGGSTPNYAVITFINDDGRFSPKNTAGPYYGNLLPNKPIRISALVGGDSVRLFTGVTGAWPPRAKGRTCQIRCFDLAVLLKRKEVKAEIVYNSSAPDTGRTFNWVFERAAWLAGIRWDYVETYGATYSSTSQDNETGTATTITHAAYNTSLTRATYRQGGASGAIAMVVDIIRAASAGPLMLKATRLEGMGLDILSKLAEVVDGRIYFDAQGALRLRSRMYVGDSSTPVETVTVDNLDDVQFSQNFEDARIERLINKATVTGTPLDFKRNASGAIVEETISFVGDTFPFRQFNAGQTYPASTNLASGKSVTANFTPSAGSLPLVTNGDTNSFNFVKANSGLVNVVIDLGSIYAIDTIKVWHYYADGRTYNATKTDVSHNGVDWVTVFDSVASGTYAESSAGRTTQFATMPVRYVRDWVNGSSTGADGHWVEIQAFGTTDAQQFAELPANVYVLASPGYPAASNFVIKSGLATDPLKELGANGLVWASGFPKFGTNKIELRLTNNNAASVVLTDLTLKAKLAAPRQKLRAMHSDTISIGLYGQRDVTIQNDFIPDNLAARNLAEWKVVSGKDLKEVLVLPMMHAVPWVELGDPIQVSETVTNIVPAASNYVVRAYNWRVSTESFTVAPEVAPPAPAFSLATAITGIQEVSNANQKGATGDSLPFPAVANVGRQIGLTNINAFTDLMASIRKITNGTIASTINGMAFYKGYLWAVSINGYIWQIDPVTMTTVNQWRPDANSIFIDCKVYGRYLYIADTLSGPTTGHRIMWFDMDNPGVVSGTNWGTKVVLGTLATPVQNPRFLLIRGTKLYVHCKEHNSPSFTNQDARLVVVDVASTALVAAAEANLETTSGAGDAVSNVLKVAGDYLWALSRDNPTTKLISSATLAGATTITVDNVTGLYVGQPLQIGPSGGGAGTDRVWLTNIAGTTLTVSPAMSNAHPTTDYVFAQKTTIAKVNMSTNAVESITTVNEGFNGQGLEWDGRFLWATFLDRIVRYDYASGAPVADKSYLSGSGTAGSAQFDGSYLWWTRAGQIVQLDPRSASSIAEFTDDSTSGGLIIFDGRSIFKSGSGGSVYAVPRWTSQAN